MLEVDIVDIGKLKWKNSFYEKEENPSEQNTLKGFFIYRVNTDYMIK